MNALLDTHVLLWLLDDSPQLGEHTRDWLAERATVHVSAASVWEVAIKAELGKLSVPEDLVARVEAAGLEWLAVSPQHAWAVRSVSGLPHRDPFDRMLLAQAATEGLTLVTADALILGAEIAPAVRIRDARL